MKKRIFTLILALAVCAGLMAVPAGAYDMGKAGEYAVIGAGSYYTAVIDQNSALWMWGGNGFGQLGNGGDGNVMNSEGWIIQTTPVKVLDNVAAVRCGRDHTAAIKTDGTLWMWGHNEYGQLGNGGGGNSPEHQIRHQTVPVKVLDNVAAVSCGEFHTAAIKTDGTLWTWGVGFNDELGISGIRDSLVPVKVMDNAAAVSCGEFHTAAIKTDGTLWMWGGNSGGQLGNGSTTDFSTPVKVMDNVAAVSCGDGYTAAIKTDGTLWMWGYNHGGQLGNGTKTNSSTPVKVMDNVAAVSCGNNYTAAIKTDSTLWTWGKNSLGRLGNGGVGNATDSQGDPIQTVPVKVLDNVAAVSCGNLHTAALKTDGSLWTWGSNDDGVLGYEGGNSTYRSTPIQTVPRQVTGVTAPKGVRIYLDGGLGTGTLWTSADGTIQVPTNPTKEGYTFGGWYTDEALTIPWNFTVEVTGTLVLYARWIPITTVSETTGQSLTTITLNGKPVSVQTSVLLDANGNGANYVKLRDIAALLDGTGAQFNVDYRNGAIYVDSSRPYTTRNGTELKPIQGCDGSYMWNVNPVLFDGVTAPLEGIVLTDGDGGGHTFFKLRDLASALGFTVEWTPEQGVTIKTN